MEDGARVLLRAWFQKKMRRWPVNKLDPMTLDPLSPPLYLLVNAVGCVHGFNPVTLADYFVQRRLFENPFTREKLNDVEVRRLANMLPADRATAVHRAFRRSDGDDSGGPRAPPPPTRDGDVNAADDDDVDTGSPAVFSVTAMARSVHFIITCMLDLCRVAPDATLLNGYTTEDVLNIFNFVLMPCLFTSSMYERSMRGHNSVFLQVVNEGIALVNVLRTVNRGLQHLYFCEPLLGNVTTMLVTLASAAAMGVSDDQEDDGPASATV
jgi:hypothetical protein